jgi:hypothetical protein
VKLRVLAATAALLGAAAGTAFGQQAFSVGEAVEIEASKHWVPCVVTQPGPQVVRVNCSAYPALSRAAGSYIAQNDPASIRKATGAVGLAPAPKAAPKAAAAQSAGLKVGEYACYGSGGRPMIGLGFKVLAGGRYTDLDGKNPGSFTVSGSTVTFRGGHLDGQVGRDLNGANFRIGAQASCEPW